MLCNLIIQLFNAHNLPPVCRVSIVHIRDSFVLLISPLSDTGMFSSHITHTHVKKLGHLIEFHSFMYQDIILNCLVLGRS